MDPSQKGIDASNAPEVLIRKSSRQRKPKISVDEEERGLNPIWTFGDCSTASFWHCPKIAEPFNWDRITGLISRLGRTAGIAAR